MAFRALQKTIRKTHNIFSLSQHVSRIGVLDNLRMFLEDLNVQISCKAAN